MSARRRGRTRLDATAESFPVFAGFIQVVRAFPALETERLFTDLGDNAIVVKKCFGSYTSFPLRPSEKRATFLS